MPAATSQRKQYLQRYYRLNQERIRARNKAHYAANRDRIAKRGKEWRGRNLEVLKLRQVKYAERYFKKHPGRRAETWSRYYQQNRVKVLDQKSSYNKKRYSLKRDGILAKGRQYQATNKGKIKAQQKTYRKTNAQKLAQSNRAWRGRNKAWIQSYHKTNPHIQVMAAAKRRALKHGAAVDILSIKDWMARIKSSPAFRCYYCKRTFSTMDVHFDHILPLTRFKIHKIGNLCASCPACNLSKSDKLPSEWTKHSQSIFDI